MEPAPGGPVPIRRSKAAPFVAVRGLIIGESRQQIPSQAAWVVCRASACTRRIGLGTSLQAFAVPPCRATCAGTCRKLLSQKERPEASAQLEQSLVNGRPAAFADHSTATHTL